MKPAMLNVPEIEPGRTGRVVVQPELALVDHQQAQVPVRLFDGVGAQIGIIAAGTVTDRLAPLTTISESN